jgi:hypothetical protein
MFRYVVAILLMVASSAPAFATCTFECAQRPFDSDGDGNADSTLWSCDSVTQGSLLQCEVKVRCWRMAGAGRYCEPYCDGDPCYYI